MATVPGPGGAAITGAELIWDLGRGWEVGLGGRYEYRRFRLDDDGIAPDGVGQETGVPIWGRLSYRFNPNLSLDFYGGYTFLHELELTDDQGHTLAEEDVDPAPLVAVFVQVRF